MKYLLVFCLLLPFSGFAQTQTDYEKTLDKFVKYYNDQRGEDIIKMWLPDENSDAWMKQTWGKEHLTSMHKEYGKILTYKYLGIDTEDSNPGLAVFKTKFSVAGWKTTSFTLDKGNHFETFRFITSSEGIDKLLKKEK